VVPDRTLLEARAEARRLADEQQLAEADLAAWDEELGGIQARGLQATRDAAARAVDEAEVALGDAEVRAPAAGQVLNLDVAPGEQVAAGTAVATLQLEGASVLAFDLPPDALEGLTPGTEVLFADAAGSARHGRVVSLPVAADETTGLAPLLVTPDDDGPAPLPGMLVRGELVLRRLEGALLVPEQAVVRADERLVVVAVDQDQRAHTVDVEVRGRHGGLVAVSGDLQPGAQVVVAGGYNLPDGSHVVVDTPAGDER
jgi:RND family efflux transporter MFP subunit